MSLLHNVGAVNELLQAVHNFLTRFGDYLQDVYTTCTRSTRLITGSTRSIPVHLVYLLINRPHLVIHLVGRVHRLANNGNRQKKHCVGCTVSEINKSIYIFYS